MARIRTIKPEFFTSEDIISLSPLARLLFQACWCEADREGRMEWKPNTMKFRYFPGDNCDINAVADEVVQRGLVELYEVSGRKYAFIPTFSRHQHINPRESVSVLPSPDQDLTRGDASRRVKSRIDAQVGREGKGKEGKEGSNPPLSPLPEIPEQPLLEPAPVALRAPKTKPRSQIPANWRPNEAGISLAEACGLDLVRTMQRFTAHHQAKGSLMADWQAAWRTWCTSPYNTPSGNARHPPVTRHEAELNANNARLAELFGSPTQTDHEIIDGDFT